MSVRQIPFRHSTRTFMRAPAILENINQLFYEPAAL